ncbi:MAG: phosphopantothenate/pantothenate synthetase [Methanomassiliicoccales archaeon]|jgi:4-phosphopantoate--beta-alanine ligase|nr:phosphopantothenate/pantothenate synthetase [Methanomassiliicoccales archaeon]
MEIPKDHPRRKSLETRERLAELSREGIVSITGLIAHGRGEAFDYLLGEKTVKEAAVAEEVAVAYLLEAKNPVISVNGNVAALCAQEIVRLAKSLPAKIEVNLFHRSNERVEKVCAYLERAGATHVLGRKPDARLEGISSDRALCTREGIYTADVVLVPLEDGDRAEALVRAGKVVIAIDLNPLSRTSRTATISIVDEVTRAISNMQQFVPKLKDNQLARKELILNFDNKRNLREIARAICRYLDSQFQ